MPSSDLLQLGALAIIFFFAIREFFAYLRHKGCNGNEMKKKGLISDTVEKQLNFLMSQ